MSEPPREFQSPSQEPRRRMWRWLLLATLAFVSSAGAFVLYRITRPNLPIVDYKQKERELIESWLSDADRHTGENAFDSIRQAGRLYESVRKNYEYRGDFAKPDDVNPRFTYLGFHEAIGCDANPSEDSVPAEELLRAVADVEASGALEHLDSVALTRSALIERDPSTIMFGNLADVELPRPSRALARMNAFRAMRRLESGDIDEAVRSIEHSLAMARVWKSQSGMVEYLVGYSITAVALYGIRSHIGCPIPEQRRALLAILNVVKSIEDPPPLSRPLQGERLALLEMYQSAFTGIPPRDDSMTSFPPAWWMKLTIPQVQSQAADAVNAFYDAAILWVDAPPAERPELRRRVHDIADATSRFVTLAMLIPSIEQAISTRTRLISEIRATTLVLAIALYREEYDLLPTSLEELSPSILASIPTDPFAPDGAFRYRIDGDPANRGGQFTLYSVGPDGIDNGGIQKGGNSSSPSKEAPDEGTDIVFFPVPE